MLDYHPVALATSPGHNYEYLIPVPAFYLLGSPAMSARRPQYYVDENEE